MIPSSTNLGLHSGVSHPERCELVITCLTPSGALLRGGGGTASLQTPVPRWSSALMHARFQLAHGVGGHSHVGPPPTGFTRHPHNPHAALLSSSPTPAASGRRLGRLLGCATISRRLAEGHIDGCARQISSIPTSSPSSLSAAIIYPLLDECLSEPSLIQSFHPNFG